MGNELMTKIAQETRRARRQELINESTKVGEFMLKKGRPAAEIEATLAAYAAEIDRLDSGAPRVSGVPTDRPEPYLAPDEDALAAWEDFR